MMCVQIFLKTTGNSKTDHDKNIIQQLLRTENSTVTINNDDTRVVFSLVCSYSSFNLVMVDGP